MFAGMTAFSAYELVGEQYTLNWHLRSLNSRFLELNFKLPEKYFAQEIKLRELIKSKIQRGKIDVFLKEIPSQHMLPQIDWDYVAKLNAILQKLPKVNLPDALTLLNFPGVKKIEETVVADLSMSFMQALEQLIAGRLAEGRVLADILQQKILSFRQHFTAIMATEQETTQVLTNKLTQKIADLQLNISAERLEQEIVCLVNKASITEEIDRITMHLDNLDEILATGCSGNGKRLDFIVQELNREVNTLAAKTAYGSSNKSALELKIIIEQLREQIQNLE